MEREIRANSPESSSRRKLEEEAALLLHDEIAMMPEPTAGASEMPAEFPIPLNIGESLSLPVPPFPSRGHLVNIQQQQRKRKLNWHEAAAAMNPNFLESDRLGLYDPSYEAIGIPLDPHLRIFNGGYENGRRRGESSKEVK